MGFWGVGSYHESDNASDFYYTVGQTIQKKIEEEMKKTDNEYNTDGWINVLLMIVDDFGIVKFFEPGFVERLSRYFNLMLEQFQCEEDSEIDEVSVDLKNHIISFNSSSIVMEKLQEYQKEIN